MAFICGQTPVSGVTFVSNQPPIEASWMTAGIRFTRFRTYNNLCGTEYKPAVYRCVGNNGIFEVSGIFVNVITPQLTIFPNIELRQTYQTDDITVYTSSEQHYDLPENYYQTVTNSAANSEANYIPVTGVTSLLETEGGNTYSYMNPKSYDFQLYGILCSGEPSTMWLYYNQYNFILPAGGENVNLTDVRWFGQINFACSDSGVISTGGGYSYANIVDTASRPPDQNLYQYFAPNVACNLSLFGSGINVL